MGETKEAIFAHQAKEEQMRIAHQKDISDHDDTQPLPRIKETFSANGPDSEVTRRLKEIIIDQLNVDESEIVPDASFAEDFNADSLDLAELRLSVEDEFKLLISDEEAKKLLTVQDAVDWDLPTVGTETWNRKIGRKSPMIQGNIGSWDSSRWRYHKTRSMVVPKVRFLGSLYQEGSPGYM